MARQKKGVLEVLAVSPWQVGAVAGVLGFLAIRFGIPAYLAGSASPMIVQVGKQLASGSLGILGSMVLLACWGASFASFIGAKRRRALLEAQRGLDTLLALSWRQFELLVGEAYRRRGYAVEETGQGGADGGIDLLLRKPGEVVLVQCKQWRRKQVDVKVVREMFGLLGHHNATSVKIVGVGEFTRDAAAFARNKPIELVTGEMLLALVSEVQGRTSPSTQKTAPASAQPSASVLPESGVKADTPACPRCQAAMVIRKNRKTAERFWGCSGYPSCRGMLSMTPRPAD